MKHASCPSCGAPVVFRAATSLYVVCEFCRSTLLRSGDDLQNLGRMADLLDDPSLIQIGSEGTFRNRRFAVVGRIQLQYEAGLWNEWHIVFDDGRSAWLAEAAGEIVVSALAPVSHPLPEFATLVPEQRVSIEGREYVLTGLLRARCIAGQGELPFAVRTGYDVHTADLRGHGRFLTIDYSEVAPLLFVGQSVAFADLALTNLRQSSTPDAGSLPQMRVRAFNCPHCAAPLAIHSPAIESVGCDSCGSIIGVDNDNIRLLQRAAQALRRVPWLPLGSRGRWQEIEWEVIGFVQRGAPDLDAQASWSEYLLFHVREGFAWLIEYQGHWNFARVLGNPPSVARGQKKFRFAGNEFRLFNSGVAEVQYVVGEFYWRVAVGERCTVDDYIAPPLMLSREVSANEASWSKSEYVDGTQVATAFAVSDAAPKPRGVYANQPNPGQAAHRTICRMFWQLALAATVLQLAFVFLFASQVVLRQQMVFSPASSVAASAGFAGVSGLPGVGEEPKETAWSSEPFVLGSRARALLVRHDTDLTNNWLSLEVTLIERNTGEAYEGVQELSHYKGVDDGESWSEGSPAGGMVFRSIPAGTYYLVVDYELGEDQPQAVAGTLEVVRNPAAWSNFVLLLVFLVVFPLFSRWRCAAFETRRWQESDLGEQAERDAGRQDDD